MFSPIQEPSSMHFRFMQPPSPNNKITSLSVRTFEDLKSVSTVSIHIEAFSHIRETYKISQASLKAHPASRRSRTPPHLPNPSNLPSTLDSPRKITLPCSCTAQHGAMDILTQLQTCLDQVCSPLSPSTHQAPSPLIATLPSPTPLTLFPILSLHHQ